MQLIVDGVDYSWIMYLSIAIVIFIGAWLALSLKQKQSNDDKLRAIRKRLAELEKEKAEKNNE